MHKPALIAAMLATQLLTSCVAPLSHTYFVPNSADGKPVQSSSCGFLKNNQDALERISGNFSINVSAYYAGDGKLSVNLLFRYPSRNVEIKPENIRVQEATKNVSLEPVNTRVSSYGPDSTHPYTLSVTLQFSETATDINSLTISLRQEAVFVDGQEVPLTPFRFKQRTSTDLYYASINC